jgi:putative DNA primase/helicase
MSAQIDVHGIVAETLLECGWLASNSSAIGFKSFDTVVGVKQAQAYLSKGDGFNRTLNGEYQSEGRNVLSSKGVLIPVNADADTVRRLACQFARQADLAVAESYAASLYLLGCRLDSTANHRHGREFAGALKP